MLKRILGHFYSGKDHFFQSVFTPITLIKLKLLEERKKERKERKKERKKQQQKNEV